MLHKEIPRFFHLSCNILSMKSNCLFRKFLFDILHTTRKQLICQVIHFPGEQRIRLRHRRVISIKNRRHRNTVIGQTFIFRKISGAFRPCRFLFLCHLQQHFLIVFSKRHEIFQVIYIVLHLLQCGHTGKDCDYIFHAARKPQRPYCRRHFWGNRSEFLFSRLRYLRKNASFHRFHDDHFFPMLTDYFITPSGCDKIAFPVKIIDDDLDKLYFRMLRQNLIQYLRRIVEGKYNVSDLPFFFPFLRMFKQMAVLDDTALSVQPVIEFCVQDMEKIVICLCQVRNKKNLFFCELQTASAYSSSNFSIILHKFKYIIME